MKRLAYFIFLIATAFVSCKKEDPTSKITYEVRETSPSTPSYTIEFTKDKAGGTQVSGSSSAVYSSGTLELPQGEYVKMKVTCSDPTFELHLYVYVNGNLWGSTVFANPTPFASLEGNIPGD